METAKIFKITLSLNNQLQTISIIGNNLSICLKALMDTTFLKDNNVNISTIEDLLVIITTVSTELALNTK
jgi:hypothetical protein